jgi:DNA (cytosine-5)-methyltransferase 1
MGNREVKYISICSGIEAATTAWHGLGWEPLAFSEIEPFPSAVLAHHYPDVPNLGDMSKYREWPEELLVECDLLVGGTPCQAFSVAGLRKSLDDERGNLSLVYVHLFHHINEVRKRHGRSPAIALWENVPGVLSTKDNAFGCFISGLLGVDETLETEDGKWPKAGFLGSETVRVGYRILDAQYFAVAQRRRRVFLVAVPCELVASLGERACPSEILSLRESVLGNPPTRGASWEGFARPTASSLTSSGRGVERCGESRGQGDVVVSCPPTARTLTQRMHKGFDSTCDSQTPIVSFKPGQSEAAGGTFVTEEFAPTIQGQNNGSTVVPAVAFNGYARGVSETAWPVMASDYKKVEIGVMQPAATPIDLRQASRGDKVTNNRSSGSGGPPGAGVGNAGDPAFTVSERGQAVAFKPSHYTRGKDGKPDEIAPPLSADADKGDQDTLVMRQSLGFNWQNGGGYGNANDGLGITEEGTGPLSRSQVPACVTGPRTHALTTRAAAVEEDGTGRGTPIVPVQCGVDTYNQTVSDVSIPLRVGNAKDSLPAAMVPFTKAKRAQSASDDESWVPGEVAPTQNQFDVGDTRATTVVAIQERAICENPDAGPDGAGVRSDGVSYTLEARTAPQAVAFTQNSRDEVRKINGDGQIAGSLSAEGGMHQTNYIAFANRTRDGVKVPEVMKDGVVPALTNPGQGGRSDAVNVVAEGPVQVQWASGGGKVENPTMQSLRTSAEHNYQFIRNVMQVRRLTPTECCRLQGFPDDHCDIVYRKKPAADGPKYRALGNSMAVPCMAWLGWRIHQATGRAK